MPDITYTTTTVRQYERGERLKAVLNKKAYELLYENNYELALAVEAEIGDGMSADDIRRMILDLHYQAEMAQKCYQAALYLEQERSK